jgi:hypothetical protein
MLRWKRFGPVGLSALALAGCITARYEEGNAVPWERVSWIEPGRTTRSQILDWFGAPRNFASSTALSSFLESRGLEASDYAKYPFTDVFAYECARGQLSGFTAILYTRLRLELERDLLVILFDERDTVTHVGTRRILAE